MATNKFLIFDENSNNIQSDATYSASTTRTNGITPGLAPKELYNKLFRQVSVMVSAFGEILKNSGVSSDDSNLATLTTSLTTVLSASNKILSPTANLAAIKAIDTTLVSDSVLNECKTLGTFRFDSTSVLTADDVNIIQPTTGSGRWIKIAPASFVSDRAMLRRKIIMGGML